jgi:formylmethanofuran dehydrogenase subunit E
MKRNLRMKCSVCGHWNRVPVNRLLVEQDSSEPKVKVFIPMHLPLQVSKCEKCGEVIAQPKELIKIVKSAEI